MAIKFKHIGIISKFSDLTIGETVDSLAKFLLARNIEVLLDESAANTLAETDLPTGDFKQIGEQCELVIVVGGDGTMLNAARGLSDYDIPLVGVNLGRLGFLTDVSPNDMFERLDEILSGQYYEEKRFLLQSSVMRDEQPVQQDSAFNDIVIHKWNSVRMIEFATYVDGKLINNQRSDGLIISTPTGSTAYALSGGGPIVHPSLNAIILAPICPHTLSNRPLVIDGDSCIEIMVKENDIPHVRVTLDGQANHELQVGDTIKITKKDKPIRLLHPSDHDHYQILRAKLRWG